jgi:hypothetical protein
VTIRIKFGDHKYQVMLLNLYRAVCAGLKLLEQAGISLAALDTAAATDASLPPDVLLAISDKSSNSIAWSVADDGSLQEGSSSSSCIASSSTAADLQDETGKAAAAAAAADATHTAAARDQGQQQQQPVWLAPGSPDHERLQALALLRRLLVLSRQQPGPAGLLSNTAAVDALQELLPFAPLLQLATDDAVSIGNITSSTAASAPAGCSGSAGESSVVASGALLAMLPPAQRAWLLGDAAAAVLLPAKDGTRWGRNFNVTCDPLHYCLQQCCCLQRMAICWVT